MEEKTSVKTVNVQVIAQAVNAQIANKLVSIVMNVFVWTVTVQTL